MVADTASFTAKTIDDLVAGLQDVRLTVLVNNVGGVSAVDRNYKRLGSHSHQDVDAMVNLNQHFTTQLTRALLPALQRNQPSLILNTGSFSHVGMPYLSVYSGTKAYLRAWSKALDLELKAEQHAVEVLYVTVGAVQSGRNRPKTSLFVPSSQDMAHAALLRVGCGSTEVTGYAPHAFQFAPMKFLPSALAGWMLTLDLKGRLEQEEKGR